MCIRCLNKASLSQTDVQNAVAHLFSQPSWKQWADPSQSCHPSQSRGTREPKTDVVSANLISGLCFFFYMGCTLIEITNKTGLNWVNYIVGGIFSASHDISWSLPLFLLGDWCSPNRHHIENISRQCLMMVYMYFLVVAAARSLEPLQYFQQLMLLGVCRWWFKKGVCQHIEL